MTEATPSTDHVVLLDADSRPTGTMDKLDAHRMPGHAHLAFSVLLQAPDGRRLLQRRAIDKHHFADAWANTCCSHPRSGEPVRAAATRRLGEELGLIDVPELTPWAAFWYEAHDEHSGLVEVEYDVVLTGRLDADHAFEPVTSEVAEVAWLEPAAIRALLEDTDARVAPWLPLVLRAADGPRQPIAASIPL